MATKFLEDVRVLDLTNVLAGPYCCYQLALMGAYIGQNNSTELLILVGFGVCATILKFADYPLAPLLIGFILGTMLEDNFARSMNLYDGASFIWERPMTLGLLILSLVLVVLPSYRARRARLKAAGIADGD